MELYAYRENGEFIGTIDFYTSLRWRRQYWTAGEVELHLPATKENLAAIKAGVILRRVGYTESARIMGIKTKGGEITANARMLEIYFSMAYVIGTKSFTGTPAEILCQLAEDARESVPELVVDKTALPSGAEITIQLDFKNTLKAMTAVAKAYGLGVISEGYHCNYGVSEDFAAELESGDLRVTGWDEAGDIRAIELVTHPFFVGTLFQHERGALAGKPVPLVQAMLRAARG